MTGGAAPVVESIVFWDPSTVTVPPPVAEKPAPLVVSMSRPWLVNAIV